MEDTLLLKALQRRQKISILKGEQLDALYTYYSFNPACFINDLMFTFDPRLKGAKVIPFLLFDRQRDYINFLLELYEDRDDGVLEKCRDVGASWLNAGFTVWLFIFRRDSAVLWGANKVDLVDKLGDMSSLMERIDFILRTLPNNFRPNYTRNYLKILNRDNSSQITGAGGDTIGRGGRSSMTFVDEGAFIERAEVVDASLSMTSDCTLWLSTPNGQNFFYKKRMSKNVRVFTFKWSEDPRKSQEWFDKQKAKLLPHIFAQEVLIDYSASVENQLIKNEWVQACIEFELPLSGIKCVGFDIADEGADSNATAFRHGSVVMEIQEWREGTVGQSSSRVWNYAHQKDIKADVIAYDGIGVGSGAKSKFHELDDDSIHIERVMIGESAGDEIYLEGETAEDDDKKYSDVFHNMRARLWWELREKIKATWEHANGHQSHPIENMISLPHDDALVAELTAPKWELTEVGKIKIESKKNMKKRGIDSPNRADALIMSYYPAKPKLEIFFK